MRIDGPRATPTTGDSAVVRAATRGAAAALLGVALMASPGHAKAQQTTGVDTGGAATTLTWTPKAWATTTGWVPPRSIAFSTTAPDSASSVFATRLAPKTPLDRAGDELARSLVEALTPSAHDLASGVVLDGDEATRRLARGAERFVRHAPIALLSDDLASSARALFADRGVDVAAADRLSIADLGDAGGRLVADRIDRLRRDEPVVFGALAAVALGGVVAVANDGGSDALRKIGIRPEARASLFDGRVGLRVRTTFADHFKDVDVGGGVSLRFDLPAGGRGWASVDVAPNGDAGFVLELKPRRDLDVVGTLRRVDGETRYGVGVVFRPR